MGGTEQDSRCGRLSVALIVSTCAMAGIEHNFADHWFSLDLLVQGRLPPAFLFAPTVQPC